MNTLAKTLVGTVAAGAMAMTSVAPAYARDRGHGDGISAGDVIAGALIIGGIAAIASASSKDRGYDRGYNDGYPYDRDSNYRYDRRGNHGNYNDYYGRGNPRSAVEQCVRAAESNAARSGYRFANVTNIRDVDDKRFGWRVKGTIEVQGQRGYGRDRYGDSGKFTCDISRGRVVGLDYSGIRGL